MEEQLSEQGTAHAGPGDRVALLGMDRRALEAWAIGLGEPPFRGRQLARWIYRRGARSFDEMSDLPASLRGRLPSLARLDRAEIRRHQASADGTRKLLLAFPDGREIETVLLPYPDRVSICISSQVGCPVGCVFCATATMGLARNLTAGEMVDQVLTAREFAPGGRVTHVVVMGMGEPMLNYEATVAALRLLHDEVGISYRHLTLSTAGHVPGILRLAEEGIPVTLALSLHAPNDRVRDGLIPMSRKWGVEAVMEAVQHYTERTGRRVTLEYLLLAGVNDGEEHAEELGRLVRGTITHVNLIPWNPAETLARFQAPSRRRVERFRARLERAGVTVTERQERGRDISAACGQLAVLSGAEAPAHARSAAANPGSQRAVR